MSRYFQMTDLWMEKLLDDTRNYTIEINEQWKFINILVNVKKESMGKIIGKNGRVITSLRTLVSSVAKKDKKIVKIEVKEF